MGLRPAHRVQCLSPPPTSRKSPGLGNTGARSGPCSLSKRVCSPMLACARAEDMDKFSKVGSSNERRFRHEELRGGRPQAWGSRLHAWRGASISLEGLALE
jgi:hypothetical protein